jgi:hypothetical protein
MIQEKTYPRKNRLPVLEKVIVPRTRRSSAYVSHFLLPTDIQKIIDRGNPVDVVISKFSRTYERAKSVRYTQPYLTFRQALIVNKIHAAKNNIEDYPMDYLRQAKVRIAVREETSYVEYAGKLF